MIESAGYPFIPRVENMTPTWRDVLLATDLEPTLASTIARRAHVPTMVATVALRTYEGRPVSNAWPYFGSATAVVSSIEKRGRRYWFIAEDRKI